MIIRIAFALLLLAAPAYAGTSQPSGGTQAVVLQKVGSSIASAATIAPAAGIHHVTGTTAISTITLPTGMSSTVGGCISLIADAAWSTTTAGNIATALTATVGTPYLACYEGSKWYIKP